MKKINLKIINIHGKPFNCECCGSCYPHGIDIEYNDKVIWHQFSDDHLNHSQTEDSILHCIMKQWLQDSQAGIDLQSTEEARDKWNEQHYGNVIASTPENWKEHNDFHRTYLTESYENIIKNCENLPDDKILQVKMIALWIESETNEQINIKVATEKH